MTEIYFEFRQVGNVIKVTAIDSLSGTEASIVGDPKTSQNQLELLAHKKLVYVLEKNIKDKRLRSEK